MPQPVWMPPAPALRRTTRAFIDPGASPRPSQAAGPRGRWALAGAAGNICNHSQAGAVTLIPGLPGLVGLGWRWLGAFVKFPAPSSRHGETETWGGGEMSFPRAEQKTRLVQTSPTSCDGEPRAFRKHRGNPSRERTQLAPPMSGQRERLARLQRCLRLRDKLRAGEKELMSSSLPGTAGVLAGPQGERLVGSCPTVGTL